MLADLLRTNAAAIDAAVRSGRKFTPAMLRAIAADLRQHADLAERMAEGEAMMKAPIRDAIERIAA